MMFYLRFKVRVMSQYHRFTPEDAAIFANDHSELFGVHSKLTSVSFGENHMNQVFRVKNQFGTSLVVKQALPVARGLSEQWPLSLDRLRIEAETLIQLGKAAPDHVVEMLYYDSTQAAMLLEDLAEYELLSKTLASGRQFQQLGEQLATLLAHSSFFSSDFASNIAGKTAARHKFSNPEAQQIIEDLLLSDPYINHERNQHQPHLQQMARQLWQDEQLHTQVASLRAAYRSSPQALQHGDLGCSSIFVCGDELKVIDAEFACYGPVGFDLGILFGSLMLQYCAAPGVIEDVSRARDQQNYLHNQIKNCWSHFSKIFITLCQQHCRDPLWGNSAYQQQFVLQVLRYSVGFAGTELIRRVIGAFPAAEFKQIANATARQQAQQQAITLGCRLIMLHTEVSSISQLLSPLQDLQTQ